MRRALLLVLAVLAGGCGRSVEPEPVPAPRVAEPQRVELGWRETYPERGPRLVFTVETLAVTADGWSADVAVTNRTAVPFETRRGSDLLSYGLMLFRSGSLEELEEQARSGGLPALRRAVTIEPQPPRVLAPNATWRGRLSAPGALAEGAWVRVSFGPLVAQGDPPADMEPVVVWITDHAHQL